MIRYVVTCGHGACSTKGAGGGDQKEGDPIILTKWRRAWLSTFPGDRLFNRHARRTGRSQDGVSAANPPGSCLAWAPVPLFLGFNILVVLFLCHSC